ncbi:hypothetical protein NQ317_019686 [Molorchus minor]|uniref:Ras-related protein Rab-18 n=1 Tax=Molorchus minor TaxID=1323400 RepID=A0ABQ9J0N4_9CUCU|nr:hypothetical protein NQ317_019686 [Molorchus minor]
MKMDEDILTTLKILIIGESGVGKSSLLLRFTEDNFDPEQTLTIGVDFKTRKVTIDGNTVKLAIWDTAGQERFRTLTPSYYRDATWLNELETYSTKSNIIKMIVGNKIDVVMFYASSYILRLMDNFLGKREVSREEAMKFARRHQTLYIEASAKTRDGVERAFEELVHKIIQTPGLWESYAGDQIHIGEKDHIPQSSCSSYCSLV